MKLCEVSGCPRRKHARGMCTTHLYRHDNGLPLDTEVRQYERDGICKVDGCERLRSQDGQHGSADFCFMHLRRQQRRGDPGAASRERSPFGEAIWNEPDYSRGKKLQYEYGLTTGEYDELLAAQGGGCAVCGSKDPKSKRAKSGRSFSVDHDHVTGHVRGLLCSPCNRGLGLLGDEPETLERAARYLRAHQQAPLFGPTHRSQRT